MATAQSIILHHFDDSPFSEKIRLALRIKNLAWVSAETPMIMPKPDLLSLTGGYRRTPVMQIGADIFCDTALILAELERRFQLPALQLPGHEGMASMVAAWVDGKWFQTSLPIVLDAMGKDLPRSFIEDRRRMADGAFDVAQMKAAAPGLRDQWRSQFAWIEERLDGGRHVGAGAWLVGTKPGLVDVHAFMNPWFVERNDPDFFEHCLKDAPLGQDWYRRLKAFEGQKPQTITSAEAVDIARKSVPRLKPASTIGDLRDFEPGDKVTVTPDDYGRDPVVGDIVIANTERVILARTDDVAENVHVHFPRVGYMLAKA